MKILALLCMLFLPVLAAAQPVQQSGRVTPGHVAQWTTSGVLQDGGPANDGTVTNLGLLGKGLPLCINDARIATPSGYHQLCLGANALGGGTISYNAYGGASALPFQFIINGVTYNLPGGGACPLCGTIAEQNADNVDLTGGTFVSRQNNALMNAHAGAYNILDGAWPAPGALCDSTTDDAPAINALVAVVKSNGGGTISVPGGRACKVSETVVIPEGVVISGENGWSSQLNSGTPSMTMISTTGTVGVAHRTGVTNLRLNPSAAGAATGVAIYLSPTGVSHEVTNVTIESPCVGIDVNGTTPLVNNNFVEAVAGAACTGIRVGKDTIGAGTLDARLINNNISGLSGNEPDSGMLILDAGGLFLENNDIIQTNYGTKVFPGAHQEVAYTQAVNTDFGDTTTTASLLIDNDDSTGKVFVFDATNSWAVSSLADDIQLKNDGGGLTTGIHLAGMAVYNAAATGLHVFPGVTDWSIDNSHICGNSIGGSNITLEATVSKFAIRNNDIKAACDNFGPGTGNGGGFAAGFGINFTGSNVTAIVTGNDFTGTAPSIGGPTQDSVVANNIGADTTAPVVASATIITLPNITSTFTLTGSAAVQTIDATGWSNRKITLIPTTGNPTFITGGAAGGAICAPYSAAVGVPIEMIFSGCWYLK